MTRAIRIFILAGLVGFWIGCGQAKDPGNNSKTIRIGVLFPFTGSYASAGEDIKAGLALMDEIINGSFNFPIPLFSASGLPSFHNAKIQLIYKDTQGDPEIAAHLVDTLVKKDGVCAIIGCYSSTVTAAASERAEALGIPFVNGHSTSNALIRRGFKWFFRTTPDDRIFAENFFSFLSDLRLNHILNDPIFIDLLYENKLWGTSVAREERRIALQKGYQLGADIPYSAGQKDFSKELTLLKTSMPAIILQSSYEKDAISLINGFKSFGINPQGILGMDSGFIAPGFLKSLGNDAEFIISREVWALDISNKKPLVRKINDLFHARNKRNLTGNSARAFSALFVLAQAIDRSGSVQPSEIRNSLLKTNIKKDHLIMPWDGITFDPETGQNTQGRGIIVQVQDGQYRTVWPFTMASSKIIWPMPSWSDRRNHEANHK